MAFGKYSGDYRLENVESGGKLKTVAVYRGKLYRLADRDAFLRAKPRLFAFAAIFWLAMLAALLLRTGCAHIIYVIMPMVFAMPPFWLACSSIFRAAAAASSASAGEITRERSDKLQSRLAGGSVIAAALTGASFIGSLVHFIVSGTSPAVADIAFVLCAAAQTAAALLCFGQREAMLTEEVPGSGSGMSVRLQ